jgi:hypothetical protein
MLLDKSPEYWAREASLEELRAEVRALERFDDPSAALLDFAYVDRSMRVLAHTKEGSRDEALALADHLERVAHDTVRDQLDRLGRPYFARWRLLSEIMHRAARRLDVPRRVLDRRHVRDILRHLHHSGGSVPQSQLTSIQNEGQRSVTLKLMEQWDLIDRRASGQARMVSITQLGRLAISDELAQAGARSAGPVLKRGSELMYEVANG